MFYVYLIFEIWIGDGVVKKIGVINYLFLNIFDVDVVYKVVKVIGFMMKEIEV